MQVQDNTPPVGLSDEEELRRSGLALEQAVLGDEIEHYAEPTIGTDN